MDHGPDRRPPRRGRTQPARRSGGQPVCRFVAGWSRSMSARTGAPWRRQSPRRRRSRSRNAFCTALRREMARTFYCAEIQYRAPEMRVVESSNSLRSRGPPGPAAVAWGCRYLSGYGVDRRQVTRRVISNTSGTREIIPILAHPPRLHSSDRSFRTHRRGAVAERSE